MGTVTWLSMPGWQLARIIRHLKLKIRLSRMPLKTSRNDMRKAIDLFNEGKYYQSNLMLLSAEQGIILSTEIIEN